MADGTLKVGTITTSSGSGDITIPSGNGMTGHNYPALSVQLSTTQNASSTNAFNLINWDTVDFDTANQFNTSNYYYKITVSGKYLVQIQVRAQHNTNDQDYHGVALYKDTDSGFGSESIVAYPRMLTAYGNQTYNPEFVHTLNDIIEFSNGDFLRVKYFNGANASRQIQGDSSGQPRGVTWTMMRIGA